MLEEPHLPADLHCHTTASDSSLSPEEVIAECVKHGVTTIGITDHDEVKGVAAAVAAAKPVGIRVVPGVEMTAYEHDVEIHMLGLFIDPADEVFNEVAQRARDERHSRIYKMVDKLRGLGISITTDDVFEIVGDSVPARPHVAKALVKIGQVSSVQEAFDRYISNDGPATVAKLTLTPTEARTVIERAGGVPIVAHPAFGLSPKLIQRLIDDGCQGLEVYHPEHSEGDTRRLLEMAESQDLLISGGSDAHGAMRDGVHVGSVSVDDERVERIAERAESVRSH
jgi:hypothetical protein